MFTNKVSGVIRPGSRPEHPIAQDKKIKGDCQYKKGFKITNFQSC